MKLSKLLEKTKYTIIQGNADIDIDILYEDEYLVIVSKPSGLLTVSTDKGSENTLYRNVSSYVKESNKNNKIFIVNRLDKDTSGIVVFAKNERVKEKLEKALREYVNNTENPSKTIVKYAKDKFGIEK